MSAWWSNLTAQTNAALSPWFLAPGLLWFLALIPVIILLYLLKLRRTRVVISSTLLWFRSLHDLTANAPFQKLRKNLLLLLQIIAVLLIAFALARPFLRTEGSAGRTLCLLIDHSTSMQTVENGGTRLEQAKDRALDLIGEMGGSDRMMVVVFARSAQVLCELTDDRGRLRLAVNSIEPTDAATHLDDALLVAQSLTLAREDIDAVILSDGKVSGLEELTARDYRVTFSRIGQQRNNAGIVGFSERALPDRDDVRQTFVLVHNEAEEPLDSTVTLRLNGETLGVQTVQADPGEDGEVLFEHGPLGAGSLYAQLDVSDALEADNDAWLALRPASKVKVLIVGIAESPAAYFLQRVFAHEPQVELTRTAPSDYSGQEEADLVVFDGIVPQGVPLTAESAVYIGAPPPDSGISATGEIENPPIVAVYERHPLMRFLNPENVNIARARRVSLPDGTREIVSTEGAPLVVDASRDGKRIVYLAFDIADSDWPLRLSFPLFFQNLVHWAPRATLGGATMTAVGEPIAIPPHPEGGEATVTRPDGSTGTVRLNPDGATFYGATYDAGVYRVDSTGKQLVFAVSLADRVESSIAPAASLTLGRADIAAEEGAVRQVREFWWWLALAALSVLVCEWWIYSRRAWM